MLGVFGVVLQFLTLRTSKTAKHKLALVYPKHHSATQKGVAEVVARGKKTIPGRCFGVVFVWCGGVVVLWCCGVVVLWCCGVVVLVWWCWCGVGVVLVVVLVSASLRTPPSQSIWYPLCNATFCRVVACTGLLKKRRNWKPRKQSQPYASLRTTFKKEPINSAPSV